MLETGSRWIAVLAAIAVAVPALGDTEVEGQTAGGAYYKIVVPDAWNGTLVLWNHGFDFDPPGPVTDAGPLEAIHLASGHAVAASSLRENGWALFQSSRDLELLVQAFTANFGEPDQVILYGASLGGIVTAAALERADLGNVVGAFAFCGAMAGSRNWDGALDLRLIYDFQCAKIADAQIPGGATGLPKSSPLTAGEIEAAVNACTGVDLPASERSKAQKRNLKKILKWTTLPDVFLQTDMLFATFGLHDLTFDKGKLKGKAGVGNEMVDYGVKKLDKNIERVTPKKNAARKLGKSFTPSGKVGDVKIVSLHTDKDGLVVVENQTEYAEVVPEENLVVAVAVEDEPSHCGFSPAEVVAGWVALEAWLETGSRPTVQEVQDGCDDLVSLLGGPCRFSPSFVLRDLDRRIRPRSTDAEP